MGDRSEITAQEMLQKTEEGFLLVDLRDEETRSYGIVSGALACDTETLEKYIEYSGQNIKQDTEQYTESSAELRAFVNRLKEAPGVIFYCTFGRVSLQLAEKFAAQGIEAYSLQKGYAAYVMYCIEQEEMSQKQEEIERGLQKTWHKKLFSPFAKAVKRYELVKEGDRIAVCISGGKDSMLMAKLFQELQRHRQCHFELTFVVMDPGYSEENRKIIEKNAKMLGIPITIFDSPIFDVVFEEEKSPCYLCARMRRGYLYAKAKELGCNKIALGHHYDDVIETILMGMLYSGQIQTMMPKLHSTNFEGMELIRPMYLIREDDIKAWRDANGLKFIRCACRFTDTCSVIDPEGKTGSKRVETKMLIAKLKEDNPLVEAHIFRSVENINLDTVIGYKKEGKRHHFLDTYDM